MLLAIDTQRIFSYCTPCYANDLACGFWQHKYFADVMLCYPAAVAANNHRYQLRSTLTYLPVTNVTERPLKAASFMA